MLTETSNTMIPEIPNKIKPARVVLVSVIFSFASHNNGDCSYNSLNLKT
jgi:hypothetical protein